jgi:hypothetical protein
MNAAQLPLILGVIAVVAAVLVIGTLLVQLGCRWTGAEVPFSARPFGSTCSP